MKKTVIFALACLLVGGAAFAQGLTVTSPNGAEIWELGKPQNITWGYSGTPAATKVKIILWKEGVKIGDIASDIPSGGTGTKSYTWNVGSYMGGTAAAGSGFKIRVRAMNDPSLMDESNQSFTISPASGGGGGVKPGLHEGMTKAVLLMIKEPTHDSIWTIGETHAILWTAAPLVKYPLSIFLVTADTKAPVVDIGHVASGSQKNWTVTDNLYDGQYRIRITSADKAHEIHSSAFTIKASKITKFEVLPSTVANKVHWHNIVSGDIWPGQKFHGGISEIPDPGGRIIKYGYQRWYDDADNNGVTLHRSFVFFNLSGVIAQIKHKYTVKGAWIDWKKAANSPQACAPNEWVLDAQLIVGDGSNMFGEVFAAFPKHLLTGDQQIQINMAQLWLSDPAKNYGLVISAVNEGQTGQNGQCVQFCDGVVMKIEIEEKLNK
jgi:hypothetical protein